MLPPNTNIWAKKEACTKCWLRKTIDFCSRVRGHISRNLKEGNPAYPSASEIACAKRCSPLERRAPQLYVHKHNHARRSTRDAPTYIAMYLYISNTWEHRTDARRCLFTFSTQETDWLLALVSAVLEPKVFGTYQLLFVSRFSKNL